MYVMFKIVNYSFVVLQEVFDRRNGLLNEPTDEIGDRTIFIYLIRNEIRKIKLKRTSTNIYYSVILAIFVTLSFTLKMIE